MSSSPSPPLPHLARGLSCSPLSARRVLWGPVGAPRWIQAVPMARLWPTPSPGPARSPSVPPAGLGSAAGLSAASSPARRGDGRLTARGREESLLGKPLLYPPNLHVPAFLQGWSISPGRAWRWKMPKDSGQCELPG